MTVPQRYGHADPLEVVELLLEEIEERAKGKRVVGTRDLARYVNGIRIATKTAARDRAVLEEIAGHGCRELVRMRIEDELERTIDARRRRADHDDPIDRRVLGSKG